MVLLNIHLHPPGPRAKRNICNTHSASYDNLRLYDLHENASKHSTVPFYIIPGHHGGVISALCKYLPLNPSRIISAVPLAKDLPGTADTDATCQYLISIAGNRGWEGVTTEVLLGYEIAGVP
jgi:transcriptional activator SPT8